MYGDLPSSPEKEVKITEHTTYLDAVYTSNPGKSLKINFSSSFLEDKITAGHFWIRWEDTLLMRCNQGKSLARSFANYWKFRPESTIVIEKDMDVPLVVVLFTIRAEIQARRDQAKSKGGLY